MLPNHTATWLSLAAHGSRSWAPCESPRFPGIRGGLAFPLEREGLWWPAGMALASPLLGGAVCRSSATVARAGLEAPLRIAEGPLAGSGCCLTWFSAAAAATSPRFLATRGPPAWLPVPAPGNAGSGSGSPHLAQKRASSDMGTVPHFAHWNCANQATTDAEGPTVDGGAEREAPETGRIARKDGRPRRGSWRLGRASGPGGFPGVPRRCWSVASQ
mmetsp:Transcript_29391/g.77728  ORF Transcript_29391/g.77728 Transcript_29391/m.77728 type:complete len:216 (+) Transcript_29391:116-763(+)